MPHFAKTDPMTLSMRLSDEEIGKIEFNQRMNQFNVVKYWNNAWLAIEMALMPEHTQKMF